MLNNFGFLNFGLTVVTSLTHHLSELWINLKQWVKATVIWCPYCEEQLDLCEKKLLNYVKTPVRADFVEIGSGWGLDYNYIRTIYLNKSTDATTRVQVPVVLLHGYGSASCIWLLNLDTLASGGRPVYAIDILGFGRSSRPPFDGSEDLEWELVYSIEKWRAAIGLNKFIIVGHGFGAYLGVSYALHFPAHVVHVCLVDPWGIQSFQESQREICARQNKYKFPKWVSLVKFFLEMFSPLIAIRVLGPWGLLAARKLRSDVRRKFVSLLGQKDSSLIITYLYQCNAQWRASGEKAFKSLSLPNGWARHPMIHRIPEVLEHISITFIYGSRSWTDKQIAMDVKTILGNKRVGVHFVLAAGHHVYADKPQEFCQLLNSIFAQLDERSLLD